MATKKSQTDREEGGTESLTGTTPKLADLKVGMKLFRTYKGKRYDFEIVEVEGKRLIRMRGQKGKWASLSSAAQAVSGHAERGATVMRDAATGKTLLPVPRYDQMAATPAPKKATSKKAPAKASAPASKVRRSWQCGNCRQKFPTQALLTAHVAKEHPTKEAT